MEPTGIILHKNHRESTEPKIDTQIPLWKFRLIPAIVWADISIIPYFFSTCLLSISIQSRWLTPQIILLTFGVTIIVTIQSIITCWCVPQAIHTEKSFTPIFCTLTGLYFTFYFIVLLVLSNTLTTFLNSALPDTYGEPVAIILLAATTIAFIIWSAAIISAIRINAQARKYRSATQQNLAQCFSLAGAWITTSIVGYLIGMTLAGNTMFALYCISTILALPALTLQTTILCRTVPIAIAHRKSFRRRFHTLSTVYFITYFNALFAAGDIDTNYRSGCDAHYNGDTSHCMHIVTSYLLYGESSEEIGLLSGVIALGIWTSIVINAMKINEETDQRS